MSRPKLPKPPRPPIPEHIFDDKLCLEMTGEAYLNCGKIKADWDQMTVEAWVFPREFSHHCLISHDLSVTLKPDGVHVHTSGSDAPLSANFSIPQDAWTHVAITITKDGTHRYYRNGHLVVNLQGNKLKQGGEYNLLIGAVNRHHLKDAGDDRMFFEGKLGPVTVWKRARVQAEIIADMFFTPFRNAPDLVGCWLMEDMGRGKNGDRIKKIIDIKLPGPFHAKVKRNKDEEDSDVQLIDAQIPKPHNTDVVEFAVAVDEIKTDGVFEYVPDWCEADMVKDLEKDGGTREQLYKCEGNIDEIGTNADDDSYTMGTTSGRLMVFHATAHNPLWKTRIVGFYMKELYCKDDATDHEGETEAADSHVLKDLASIEDGRWMIARTGESGAIEYLVLIAMEHRGTKERRWVAWDPVIEVGSNDPTDG